MDTEMKCFLHFKDWLYGSTQRQTFSLACVNAKLTVMVPGPLGEPGSLLGLMHKSIMKMNNSCMNVIVKYNRRNYVSY